jgi:aminoglycoside 6-adenylyltransferase
MGEMNMRSEKQVYDIILTYAKADERVRMVTLEGSRTNTNIPPDDFQDYDITFFVTDMQSFIGDDRWLDVFGERLILQKPEDMELFPAAEKGFSYLMLFADDVKIDLSLLPLEFIDEYFTWDKLVKLLLDKDNRITQPPVPTDIDYHLQKPTERSFDDCCNEFWNTATYVVKGLCRREILFAIDHMNDIVRKELLRMISWLVGIEQGFHFSLGKNYKFLQRYIPEELWKRLMSTYHMDSYSHMWESLEQSMTLFREASAEVARRLGYQYPPYDEKISNYVIRQKAKYGVDDNDAAKRERG